MSLILLSASKGLRKSTEWLGARAACDTCLDFLSLLPQLLPSAFPPESSVLFLFASGALSLQLSPTCSLIFYLSLWLFSTEIKTWSSFTPKFLLVTLLWIPASILPLVLILSPCRVVYTSLFCFSPPDALRHPLLSGLITLSLPLIPLLKLRS